MPAALSDPTPDEPVRRPRRSRLWSAASIGVLLIGLTFSGLAAVGTGTAMDEQARRTFERTVGAVSAQVYSSLQRATDLTAAARTLLTLDPDLTNADIERWAAAVDADARYPESQGFQFIARVRAEDLAAYQAVAAADPNPGSTTFDPAAIIPSGTRPEHCFTRLIRLQGDVALIQTQAPTVLAQTDWCATAFGAELAAATDSAEMVVVSAPSLVEAANDTIMRGLGLDPDEATPEQRAWEEALGSSVFVFAPVYRDGVVPATTAERRDRAIGWVSGAFDVGAVLARALEGHDEVHVGLTNTDSDLAFAPIRAGHDDDGDGDGDGDEHEHRVQTIESDDGAWELTVAARPSGTERKRDLAVATILVVGVVASLLACTLLRVLSGSRNRALELVDERTGELRHLALHDPLTGLPNRVLVLDRAQQKVHRARREHGEVALLFIDLDHFKAVNDNFGHAAGDELLVEVARRFRAVLREGDTVGRMGGDEFVVVADGASLDGGPTAVAERLLRALDEPVALAGSDAPITVTVSIGVAAGRDDATELLRKADLALYRAKAAGRGCYQLAAEDLVLT